MKLVSLVGVITMLTMPVLAASNETELVEETITESASVKESNSDTRFPTGLELGVGVSATSGLNGFIGYANKNFDSFWLKRLGARLDFATTSPVKSMISSGIDSVMGKDGVELGESLWIKDGSINGHHVAALVDFYPFGDTWFLGGIRISGGYYFGNLDLTADLTGKVSGIPDSEFAFELNGTNYKYIGNDIKGSATADWNYRGPYLGAGFDLGLFAGFKIYMDAGVVFTSKTAQLSLNLPTDNLQKWENGQWKPVELDGIAEFEQAKREALSDAQDELDKLKFYPMIKLGFMYRF